MKLFINGKDENNALGAELSERATTLKNEDYANLLKGEASILAMRKAKNCSENLARFIDIIRRRQDVDPALYTQPRSPGIKGSISYLIRMFLWRLLRYQHFWMAFQQNAINAMHAETIDFEHQERDRQIAELQARVEKLENTISSMQKGQN